MIIPLPRKTILLKPSDILELLKVVEGSWDEIYLGLDTRNAVTIFEVGEDLGGSKMFRTLVGMACASFVFIKFAEMPDVISSEQMAEMKVLREGGKVLGIEMLEFLTVSKDLVFWKSFKQSGAL